MVRNYVQFTLRRRLQETGSTVPSRLDQPTASPTTETALLSFAAVTVVHILVAGARVGRQVTGLNEHVTTVLLMLGLDERVFDGPPRRRQKFASGVPETPEM